MNRRLILTLESESKATVCKVYFDSDWEEYQTEYWYCKALQKNATFHTTNKLEAAQVAVATCAGCKG